MLEKNSKAKMWRHGIAQVQQNGGAVEHAIGMFEVAFTIATNAKNRVIMLGR